MGVSYSSPSSLPSPRRDQKKSLPHSMEREERRLQRDEEQAKKKLGPPKKDEEQAKKKLGPPKKPETPEERKIQKIKEKLTDQEDPRKKKQMERQLDHFQNQHDRQQKQQERKKEQLQRIKKRQVNLEKTKMALHSIIRATAEKIAIPIDTGEKGAELFNRADILPVLKKMDIANSADKTKTELLDTKKDGTRYLTNFYKIIIRREMTITPEMIEDIKRENDNLEEIKWTSKGIEFYVWGNKFPAPEPETQPDVPAAPAVPGMP